MKKVVIGILVVCVIALLIVTGNLYGKVQSKESQLAAQEQKMKEIETQKTTLENKKTNSENVNLKFDPNKMKLKMENAVYKDELDYVDYITGMFITLEEGRVYVYTDVTNETYKTLFPKATKRLEGQEITGFSSNITDIHFAYSGTDVSPAKILFLMEDGTVEYIDFQKLIENKEYVSAGKLEGLSNIVKLENVKVGFYDENGNSEGGADTNVAIDQEGYAYDLSKLGL